MRDEPSDDESENSMPLEQQIQIGIGKAAGAPVLLGHNVAWLRRKLGANLSSPCAVFEDLALHRCLLDGRDVLPALVIAWAIPMVHRVEDAEPSFPCGGDELEHMSDGMGCCRNALDAVPDLAAFGDEIVVRVNQQEGRVLVGEAQGRHVLPPWSWQAGELGGGASARQR